MYSRGTQIFQKSMSHLNILGATMGDMKQIPYRGPKNIRGTKVQNLVTNVTLCPGFFHPWCKVFVIDVKC